MIHPMSALSAAKATLSRDFMASIVVFLVALPLCMGVAIASGVPPALGLVTGIIGGIIVGALAGQPLQVSGPAAGLAVMVWQLVNDYGLKGLALAVLIAGLIQLAAGLAGLGRWFRAVAPAVIQGMLAGIGVLIFASQIHVMMDATPLGGGLENLLGIPRAFYEGVFPIDGNARHIAAVIGLITIGSIVLWNKHRPTRLKLLPGALIGVIIATTLATVMSLPIVYVQAPDSLAGALNWISADALSLLGEASFWGAAIGLAIIASAETLLCATAVDRIHDGPRTNYNKELWAQGVGNILCGVVGALPMTGVIVRSSANVEAGGQTRASAILHGLWILVLVALLPGLLALIPRSALAGILVYTGWKLLGLPALKKLAQNGRSEVVIWAATVITIVAVDLLTGVIVGFALSLGRLLLTFARLEVRVAPREGHYDLYLEGAATFMSLPKLAESLEALPHDARVHVHLDGVAYIDHACIEIIEAWQERHSGEISLETDRLHAHTNKVNLSKAA